MKLCKNCGFQMEDEVQSCPNCGAQQVDNDQTSDTRSHLEPKRGLGGTIIYIFVNMFDFKTTKKDSKRSVFWLNYFLMCIFSAIVTLIIGHESIQYLIFNNLVMILGVGSMMRRLNYLRKNKNFAWLALFPIVAIYPLFMMIVSNNTDY